jgi:enterochelin esterase-like enzyme
MTLEGELVTRTFAFDGGRRATAYRPPEPPRAVIYAADGEWHIDRLARALDNSAELSTMVVGVHGLNDDNERLHEYVESFGGERFHAFEGFFVEEVRLWVQSELAVVLPSERTAVWGASMGGEFALAMGLRHPEIYGVVLCASPGGGFTPTSGELPRSIPRTYLIGGTRNSGSSTTRPGGLTHSAARARMS